MLLAGWEVGIGKNCDRGLENAEHFQARGHSFSLYGPTLRRPITLNWLTTGFVYATLPVNRLTRGPQTIRKTIERANERANQMIYELLYVSAFSSLVKVSKTVFPV